MNAEQARRLSRTSQDFCRAVSEASGQHMDYLPDATRWYVANIQQAIDALNRDHASRTAVRNVDELTLA